MSLKCSLFIWFILHASLKEVNAQRIDRNRSVYSNLVALWDFDKPIQKGWNSSISKNHFLAFGGMPVDQVFDSDLKRKVADFKDSTWLKLPRENLGELNIFGKDAKLTVMALVNKRSEKTWQAIAGVWDESRSKRQYYMFLNASSKTHQDEMKRYPSQGRLHGHISALGGKTPGEVAWISYASSKESIPEKTWVWISMTYDGKEIKVYVNGKLDKDPLTNPFNYEAGIYDGGVDGADFTVGANSVANRMTNQFIGRMAYLAVFKKDLTGKEIQGFQENLFSIQQDDR
ncbi:LamG-like jellyroll fold domain-containing protein [Algoriphagus sp.]|uniref:LamG-like jellyroll fold domain-containing protein n=1 Tax=Algoriphagus sp. TaxID=1872435 RepID=UPI00263391CB|nr:LamG-like jellyroll fold domain-containing protein [Algoriphagus sp.]